MLSRKAIESEAPKRVDPGSPFAYLHPIARGQRLTFFTSFHLFAAREMSISAVQHRLFLGTAMCPAAAMHASLGRGRYPWVDADPAMTTEGDAMGTSSPELPIVKDRDALSITPPDPA